MIQRFFTISFLVITGSLIIGNHWGRGLLLMRAALVSTFSSVRSSHRWLTALLKVLGSLFYSSNHPRRVRVMYSIFWFFITGTNLIGLYIYSYHFLLTGFNLVLFRLVLLLWMFSYRMYPNRGWNYLANALIVNMTYPSLSLLLSNIETLTHVFRPLTLIARMWVNMWVGHCILSMLSFFIIKTYSIGLNSTSVLLLTFIGQRSLFLYEMLIIFLQSTVIVYLPFVYYSDNLRSTSH